MTPFDYAIATDCEFLGGPFDGLQMKIDRTMEMLAFMSHAHDVAGIKDCGASRRVAPNYKRINDRRFQFIGYR